jgi:hypothetical protein
VTNELRHLTVLNMNSQSNRPSLWPRAVPVRRADVESFLKARDVYGVGFSV